VIIYRGDFFPEGELGELIGKAAWKHKRKREPVPPLFKKQQFSGGKKKRKEGGRAELRGIRQGGKKKKKHTTKEGKKERDVYRNQGKRRS